MSSPKDKDELRSEEDFIKINVEDYTPEMMNIIVTTISMKYSPMTTSPDIQIRLRNYFQLRDHPTSKSKVHHPKKTYMQKIYQQ